ncbi:MAG: ankyrin repeat domain-containing protein [Acidobacteriaceae bacterium]
MSTHIFDMIRRGQSAELAAEVEEHPELAGARDVQGVSALLWTVYTRQTVMRDFLRTRVAELDLFEAAATGDLPQLRALLDADPAGAHSFSGDGWTPLHLAAAFGGPEAVRFLLERGAGVHAVSRNPQQNQPLHAALALSGDLAAIRLLLDAGAEVNATQAGGFTPLHSAASAGRREAAALLLARGADPAQADHHGNPPAHYARQRGHAELADWLEAAGREQ